MLRPVEAFFQYVLGAIERFGKVVPDGMANWQSPRNGFETQNQPLTRLQHRLLQSVGCRFQGNVLGPQSFLPLHLTATPTQ